MSATAHIVCCCGGSAIIHVPPIPPHFDPPVPGTYKGVVRVWSREILGSNRWDMELHYFAHDLLDNWVGKYVTEHTNNWDYHDAIYTSDFQSCEMDPESIYNDNWIPRVDEYGYLEPGLNTIGLTEAVSVTGVPPGSSLACYVSSPNGDVYAFYPAKTAGDIEIYQTMSTDMEIYDSYNYKYYWQPKTDEDAVPVSTDFPLYIAWSFSSVEDLQAWVNACWP